jgi:hypothetical protein
MIVECSIVKGDLMSAKRAIVHVTVSAILWRRI